MLSIYLHRAFEAELTTTRDLPPGIVNMYTPSKITQQQQQQNTIKTGLGQRSKDCWFSGQVRPGGLGKGWGWGSVRQC